MDPRFTDEVREAYTAQLKEHLWGVKLAGAKLNVPEEQIQKHDSSKWWEPEFSAYAIHFFGGGAPELFAPAWLHHIHHNPHHWQHWVFPDGYTPKGSDVEPGGIVRMPDHYALEMVADWMGASHAYNGSMDMNGWLSKNIGRIKLHSKTAAYVTDILVTLGYERLVSTHKWGHEL